MSKSGLPNLNLTLQSNASLTTRFLSPQMSTTHSFGGDFLTTGMRSPKSKKISQAELKKQLKQANTTSKQSELRDFTDEDMMIAF